MIEPLKFIDQLNKLHPDLWISCTNGNCYQMFLFLQMVYPEAVAYYNSDHVITRIGNQYYDINGECDSAGYMEMSIEEKWIKDAPNWKYDHIKA